MLCCLLVKFRPAMIISGAQTGVDRGALDAGIWLGIEIGGFVPRGRRAADGRVPDRYPMVELGDPGYATRTRANIEAADATLILTHGPPTGGTFFTFAECLRLGKRHLVVDLSWKEETILWNIEQWATIHQPRTLNVAGPREEKVPGIQAQTTRILVLAFGDSAF